ncbi:hypothetical protein JOC94_000228 [Bacillus thermophilus]|uniref:Uncharacterized protein n=1 Tax=Siminovitchia thermophila TaxID=1245522 RepID=A0ABS2R0W4_9BACI|nr:hypothetical protein [Siminovitchia thermophila]
MSISHFKHLFLIQTSIFVGVFLMINPRVELVFQKAGYFPKTEKLYFNDNGGIRVCGSYVEKDFF